MKNLLPQECLNQRYEPTIYHLKPLQIQKVIKFNDRYYCWGTSDNLLNPNKNEKFGSNFSDDERGDLINNTEDKLLSFTSHVNNISSEIKALQRSIAIMKQHLPKIIRYEFIRFKGDEY